MVCYSTGTMNSLLDKLTNMENHSNATEEFADLTQEFKKAVLSLKEDFFDKLAVPKVCMKQVRELFFEIEDWIDQKRESTPSSLDQKPESNMLDPSDMEEIGNFMTEIKEARERFTWYYDLLKIVPMDEPDAAGVATCNININPRLPVEEKPCHGLLHGPREELIKHLTDDKEEMRKVVSVVGMEGLGKTTLAKQIYSELQLRQHFECQAFVSVGPRTLMPEALADILCQVNPRTDTLRWGYGDVQEIITELREYLGTKRYFILVDGIWSTWAWKVINCALPNNSGSRILTTTCSINVGKSCSSYPYDLIYKMEALSKKDSQILFLSKIKALEEQEKGASFEEVSDYMLNMCGGMPLAIIIVAGLLTRKSEELAELKMLEKSTLSSLNPYSTLEGVMKILHMSYADLSLPLRSCFLYLGVFLENYTINKDRLIQLWGAEGFIPGTAKENLWETGEMFFNELISRRLIQPVFDCDDDQAVGCTVHTVILDFVRSMWREENFATRATELSSSQFPYDTIRRYSLDCRNKDEVGTLSTSSVHLSSMRSLTVLGELDPHVPTVKQRAPFMDADDEKMPDEGIRLGGENFPLVSKVKPLRLRPVQALRDGEGKLASPPADDEEKHAAEAPGDPIMDISILTDDEGHRDPPVPPADDERTSDPHGSSFVSKHVEEMHATKAPGVSMFNLSAFKLVRVLDLEDTKSLKNDHLEGIGGLVLLRYLGLAGTHITELPEEIGELVQLETLDLRRNSGLEISPGVIVKLQKLRHLLLEGYYKEIDFKEIRELPELEVASGIRVMSTSSLRAVVEAELLTKCGQLRMLGLILNVVPLPTDADMESFLGEVVKSNLQSLSIGCHSDHYGAIPQLVDSWKKVTPQLGKIFHPQRFELKITGGRSVLMRVPGEMHLLESLTHLHIIVGKAKAEDFLVLGGLANLVLLNLDAYECPKTQTETLIIKGGILTCLKVFVFRNRNDSWMGLEFEEGAMPQLQRLGRIFRASEGGDQGYPDIGVEHLTCLTRLHATFNCQDATVSQVEAAEAAITRKVSEIATKPALDLKRRYETSMKV